jgi:imidazolonepropionase-like amidohydrolase
MAATLVRAQYAPVPAAKQTAPILIKGGTVHPGNGNAAFAADVLIENGKITRVQSGIAAPADALTVNATGKHVFPGLIAIGTNLGLSEVDAVRATRDFAETGSLNPNVRALVAYNTDSQILPTVRSNGVLLAQTCPGGGTVAGQSSVVVLDAWNWEDAAYKADDALYINWPQMRPFSFGEPDPKQQEEARKRTEQTLRDLDQLFDDARSYAAAKEAGSLRKTDLRLEALIPYIKREKPVFIQAWELNQIEAALKFTEEQNLRMVLVGGYDAPKIIDRIKARGIAIVTDQMHNLPTRADDDIEAPYKLPKQLQDAGVLYAIAHDGNWRVHNLPFQAGTAAAHGLTKEQALQALTLNAAKILGIDARTGSIEVGKDANLVISRGDILDMRTNAVEHAYIQGRSIDLGNKHKDLYKKYGTKYERK